MAYFWYNENLMLIPYTQPRFVEKILTDASGRQFRVVFAVSFVGGEVRGHIVSATEIKALETRTLCLSGTCAAVKGATEYVRAFTPVASPYFSLEFLINSQPTRAPAYN